MTSLVSRGIAFAPVTLHTGFSSQEAGEAPGPEWFEVPEASARLINAARAGGGRVIAVGTTATRAIESAVRDEVVVPADGWTHRVITPSAPPDVVDGLITGWHDPHASHLLLVEAVAGRTLTQAAYDEAVAQRLPVARVRRLGAVAPLTATGAAIPCAASRRVTCWPRPSGDSGVIVRQPAAVARDRVHC